MYSRSCKTFIDINNFFAPGKAVTPVVSRQIRLEKTTKRNA
jgi:hypothetical protein